MTGISIACRQLLRAIRCRADLERDDFSSNRHLALSFCLSMISAQTLCVCREGKPVPTRRVVARGHAFPDHALAFVVKDLGERRAPESGWRLLAVLCDARPRLCRMGGCERIPVVVVDLGE